MQRNGMSSYTKYATLCTLSMGRSCSLQAPFTAKANSPLASIPNAVMSLLRMNRFNMSEKEDYGVEKIFTNVTVMSVILQTEASSGGSAGEQLQAVPRVHLWACVWF